MKIQQRHHKHTSQILQKQMNAMSLISDHPRLAILLSPYCGLMTGRDRLHTLPGPFFRNQRGPLPRSLGPRGHRRVCNLALNRRRPVFNFGRGPSHWKRNSGLLAIILGVSLVWFIYGWKRKTMYGDKQLKGVPTKPEPKEIYKKPLEPRSYDMLNI